MKLLHVVDTLDIRKGGVSSAIDTMALQFTKMGYTNEVVSLDFEGNSTTSQLYRITALGPSSTKWHYSERLIPWLLNNFCRFDRIIVHGLWLYTSFAVRKALRKYKKLVVKQNTDQTIPKLYVMPHGMLDPYFQKSNDRKLKAFRNWIYWKLIENQVIQDAEGLLFTCKEECLLAKQAFKPYHPKNEFVVGLGVNEPPQYETSMSEMFYERCSGVRDQPYFLFLSRIDQKKGVDLLLQAYENLLMVHSPKSLADSESGKHESNDVGEFILDQVPKLVIAGPGITTKYGKKILEIAERSELLRSNVFFPGMLQGGAKWGAFYGAQSFILPSHQENFGIAVVEALACGKPVLISKQVNISQEIDEEGAGFISSDTLQGTFSLLNSWHQSSSLEKIKMEILARKCFQKHYAVPSAIKRLIAALN
jgi:glycosyltransferase involved in cell wall biosynthesis